MKTSTLVLFLPVAIGGLLGLERSANAETTGSVPESRAAPALDESSEGYLQARRFYAQGQVAFRERDLEAARRAFLRAWSLRRTYDIASALGQTELSLKRPRDAAEHLDFAMRNFPPQLNPDDLGRVRELFSRAAAQVGSLLVRVDRPLAEVAVDGRVVAQSPLSAPLFLEAGEHTIEARERGDRASQRITASAGVQQTLSLSLRNLSLPNATSSATPSPEEASRAPTPLAPLVVGGALTAVGAGVGLGFALAAASAHDRANSLRASLSPGVCGATAPPADCAELRHHAEAYDRDRTISLIGVTVSATALVATGGYWLISSTNSARPTQRAKRSIEVAGEMTANRAVLSVSGAW